MLGKAKNTKSVTLPEGNCDWCSQGLSLMVLYI